MLASFAACGKKGGDPQSMFVNPRTTTDGDVKDTVKVNLPLSLIAEEYRDDLDAFCERYGYKSAKRNSDGTVTVKMSSLSRDLLLTQVGMDSIKAIFAVAESGDYPYVKKIKSYDSKNFSEVSILVNKAKYLSAETSSLMKLVIAQSCLTYQAYAGIEEPKVKITIIDNKTKDTIEEKEFTNSDIQ